MLNGLNLDFGSSSNFTKFKLRASDGGKKFKNIAKDRDFEEAFVLNVIRKQA